MAQATATPAAAPGGDAEKAAVTDVVSSFYAYYQSCMENPPSQAAGQVSVYCQDNSGLTTDAFAANLDKGGTAKAGADPITCAQNPPQAVAVDPNVQLADGKAMAVVNETFGATQVAVQVELLLDGAGAWRIGNIVCPAP